MVRVGPGSRLKSQFAVPITSFQEVCDEPHVRKVIQPGTLHIRWLVRPLRTANSKSAKSPKPLRGTPAMNSSKNTTAIPLICCRYTGTFAHHL